MPLSNIDPEEYVKYDLQDFDLQNFDYDIRKFLESPEIINHFWEGWKNCLSNFFPYVKSTLWSYVVIRKFGERIIASAYLTFTAGLQEETRVLVNKRTQDYLYDSVLEHFFNKIKDTALKAAVSQILARNFAHNIGSHVAVRSTNTMIKSRIHSLYNYSVENKINTEKPIIDWIDFMSDKLDLYEVSRNEFLAEPHIIPYDALLYRDVILPFCENTLILDNIANSENIGYVKGGKRNRLKIRVFINNKEIVADYPFLFDINQNDNICYPDNFPYLVIHEIEGQRKPLTEGFNQKNIRGVPDISICLSSPHSLYSIMENFIRNSAKHNKERLKKGDLEITLEVSDHFTDEDSSNSYYCVKIFDNKSRVSSIKLSDFFSNINENMIKPDGTILKKHMGIADLKLNTHLLRTEKDLTDIGLIKSLDLIYKKDGQDDFTIYSDDSDLEMSNEKGYEFGYQFKLCKSQKVIWFKKNVKSEDIVDYGKKGLKIYKNLEEFINSKKTDFPLAKFKFAILDLDVVAKLTNQEPTYDLDHILLELPHRVLINATNKELEKYPDLKKLVELKRIIPTESKISLPSLKDKNWDYDLLILCWKKWLTKWVKENQEARLLVYLDNDVQIQNWNEKYDCFDFLKIDYFNSIDSIDNIDENSKIVFYDHHGHGIKPLLISKKLTQSSIKFISERSYFSFDKGSKDYINLFYPNSDVQNNNLLLIEAFEAGLTRMIILDERITDHANSFLDQRDISSIIYDYGFNSNKTIPFKADYFDLANNGNVFIVDSFNGNGIKGDPVNISFDYSDSMILLELIKDIDFPYEKNSENGKKQSIILKDYGFNCLIIHRTYLVKILDEIEEINHLGFMNYLYNNFERIILVSGGGPPHSINFKFLYKSFSNLGECFLKYPSKLQLLKLL